MYNLYYYTGASTCWESYIDHNAVAGLVPGAGNDDRPNVYYFGYMGDDVEACKSACAAEAQCAVRGQQII